MKIKYLYFISFVWLALTTHANFVKGFGLYGEDNRHEILDKVDFANVWQQSNSVALVIEKSELLQSFQSKQLELVTQTLQEKYRVCPDERFAQQKTAGLCTAFLVTKDLIVTAGHCLEGHESCQDLAFVFGLRQEQVVNQERIFLDTSKVFTCQAVLYYSSFNDNGVDLAVLRLDRSLSESFPLKIEPKRVLEKHTKLYMIGHPLGLSQKVSLMGTVIENFEEDYFSSDLDSYHINSGSPVFNEVTGLVEGALIRGQEDFVERDGCYVSSVCKGPLCLGEEVLRGSVILGVLTELGLLSRDSFL